MEAFYVASGYQLHQIPVPGDVPGQQDQMIGAALCAALVQPAAVGHVDLAADDGFDTRFLARRVEIDHPVKCSVVGDGQGIHAKLSSLGHQVWNAADTVQHAEFGVDV